MRNRVKHRTLLDQKILKLNMDRFWKEFTGLGFNITSKNDGYLYRNGFRDLSLIKIADYYEVSCPDRTKFNIVACKLFAKTVEQIESMVKYKLFK